MTKEIKFRAWEKDLEAMSLNYFDLDSEDRFLQLDRISSGRDIAWMQYTGINDKNGRLVFFGDILEFYDKEEKETYIVEVVRTINNGAGLNFGDTISDLWEDETIHTFEVIGNVYETPNLLV